MNYYQQVIRGILMQIGYTGRYDPRHIEAYMRLQRPTLDGISGDTFKQEVKIGVTCVDADGIENAERLAQSFGL